MRHLIDFNAFRIVIVTVLLYITVFSSMIYVPLWQAFFEEKLIGRMNIRQSVSLETEAVSLLSSMNIKELRHPTTSERERDSFT